MDESDEAMSSAAYPQQEEQPRREDPQDNLPEDLSLNNKVHWLSRIFNAWFGGFF